MLRILGHSLLFLAIAGVAGLMMALQGSINSVLGKKVGMLETVFIVHLTAAIILFIFLLIQNNELNFGLFKKVPWYLYLGGVIGVIITYGVIVAIPKLGVAVATTAIITAQVITAVIIDHFGIFGLEKIPITWLKFSGIILLAIGVRLLLN